MRSKGKNFEAPEICTPQAGMGRIDAESRVRYRSKPASMSAMRTAMSSAAARMLPIQGVRAGSPPRLRLQHVTVCRHRHERRRATFRRCSHLTEQRRPLFSPLLGFFTKSGPFL